jgi:hypothetical protein
MTKASHQSLRKDIMTFFDYMIYFSVNDKYAFSGRNFFMDKLGDKLPRCLKKKDILGNFRRHGKGKMLIGTSGGQ